MRFLHLSAIVCAILLLTIPLNAQENEPTSLDGRGYGLYISSAYDVLEENEVPLLIALHGAGDTWQNFYGGTGLINLAEQEGMIVAFPQAYQNEWNDGRTGIHDEDDVQILRDLIERVDRDFRVDLERVYLIGFSNGGTMAFQAVCEAPELFAGMASVAGGMNTATAGGCETQLPVMITHSTFDQVVSFNGNQTQLPVPLTVEFWVNQNDCEIGDVPDFNDALFRDGSAFYFYEDCPDGNLVMLHALQRVPHTWPGASDYLRNTTPTPAYLDTARLIWGFFEISQQAREDARANPAEATPEATESAD
ncbi:MAG: alpha/beta hydrolase family esterase [Anaerolineae bacterium]